MDELIEKYEYKGEGELINDISSPTPLKLENKKSVKKPTKKEKVEEKIETKMIVKPVQPVLSEKDQFNLLISSGSDFILKYRGNIIFDSNVNTQDLIFDDNHFMVGSKKFDYDGLILKIKR